VSEIIGRLIALKALKGRISEEYFWKRYFGLRRAFYYSPEWRALKLAGPKVCSRNPRHKGKIDRHHKKHLYDHPELALDPTNIEYVCRRCHKKEH